MSSIIYYIENLSITCSNIMAIVKQNTIAKNARDITQARYAYSTETYL